MSKVKSSEKVLWKARQLLVLDKPVTEKDWRMISQSLKDQKRFHGYAQRISNKENEPCTLEDFGMNISQRAEFNNVLQLLGIQIRLMPTHNAQHSRGVSNSQYRYKMYHVKKCED